MVDVDGDGLDEAIVECENTAAGYRRWIDMNIFKIADVRLMKIAEVDTLSTSDNERTDFERYLDIEKSRQMKGSGLHFTTTTYGNETERFSTPRVEETIVKPLVKEE